MNILNRVALQGMKKNRTRTLVTIIGVVLSAAMITAVTTFGVSLLSYTINGAIAKYGNWHVAFLNVTPAFAQEQVENDAVANTSVFENIGYAVLEGGKNPDKPYLFLTGFDEETFHRVPLNLISGRLPENSSEILVSGKVAADGGVKFAVGDTVPLTLGSRMKGSQKLDQSDAYVAGNEKFIPQSEKTYTVVGICQRPVFEENSAPGYTLITKMKEMDSADSLSLFVTLKDARQIHSYTKNTGARAYILNDNVLRFMGLSEDKLFNTMLYSVGGIVIAIIMTGSVFLIYNSFNISLNERTRQNGILLSVGATTKQLRNSVLFEGLCIGTIGIPIGIATGIVSTGLVVSVVAKNFTKVLYSNVPLKLELSVPAIIVAAAVSMITILISAYIPAKKAADTPVMECIRQTEAVRIHPGSIRTSKLIQQFCGMEGTLALKNFKRNRKRYRSIVFSLVLSIVLFISTSALVEDLKQESGQRSEITDHDIYFSTQDMQDSEMIRLYDKLKSVYGVYEGLYQDIVPYTCTVKTSGLTDDYLLHENSSVLGDTAELPMEIQFLDDVTYLKLIDDLGLPAEEYTGENAKLPAVSMVTDHDHIVDIFKNPSVNINLAAKHADNAIPGESRTVSLTFVRTVPPDSPPDVGNNRNRKNCIRVLAPYSARNSFETSSTSLGIKGMSFRSTAPAQSAADMEKLIEGEGITAEYSLYNMHGIMEENRNYIFIANVFSYTFIIMISLIAVANVFNTISTNIKLRRRELAMLRSVGMSERDFQKMMNFECAFYGMRALLIGLPAGVAASWMVHKSMVRDDMAYLLPWISICISIFGVLFIIFVTMMYSVNKIKKENIIDALQDDMA